MGKRKTHEQFIEELGKVNSDIEVLNEYKKSHTKIKCKCLKDGYLWEALPTNILRGHGCPKCAGKSKKTHEEFINEMKVKNHKIEILGKYTASHNKIKCKCLIDGYIWEAKPTHLLNKHGCPRCACNIKKTNEEFINEMNYKYKNIEILGSYVNSHTKIKFKCLIDGYIWSTTPTTILNGEGCPKCNVKNRGIKKRKSHDQFIKEIEFKQQNIEILGRYINSKTKIKCRCIVDGYIWDAIPYGLLTGRGCPKCQFSKGERIIEKYCKNNYLQYISQYKIDKCRYKRVLPFDFALLDKNKLIALIEYQGEQHYKSIKHFGGQTEFNIQKKRDEIKRNYCISNNIPLIEIPYWIDDVEGYLEEQMDKFINKPLQLSLI